MTFEEFKLQWFDSNPFITAKTSGSSGAPKSIQLSKDFVKASALRTNDFFSIGKGQHLHSAVSADFIGGKMMGVRAWEAGCEFSWETPSNTPLKEFGRKKIISLLAVVPSQMIYILENLERLPYIENIIIGGSAIHKDLRKKIAASGLNAYETYGMTETASHIALRKVSECNHPFQLLPGIGISLSEEGTLVIDFESGERIVTNDMAEISGEGEFFILGRKDNIIISGGRKINPATMEDKLSGVLSGNYSIGSLPDEKWGEKVVMFIEGTRNEEFSELWHQMHIRLEKWEVPKDIYWVKKLPSTINGKLKRVRSLEDVYVVAHDNCHAGAKQKKRE